MLHSIPPRLKKFIPVILFMILIMAGHFLYLWWQAGGYRPAENWMGWLFTRSSRVLFIQSKAMISWLGIPYTTGEQTFWFRSEDGVRLWLMVSEGCACVKQWFHWVFLMLIFPGPWKHKLWYIPSGILIIQLAGVMRITGLVVGLRYFPHSFELLHDVVFKILFYTVIFGMWVVWEEIFHSRTPLHS